MSECDLEAWTMRRSQVTPMVVGGIWEDDFVTDLTNGSRMQVCGLNLSDSV